MVTGISVPEWARQHTESWADSWSATKWRQQVVILSHNLQRSFSKKSQHVFFPFAMQACLQSSTRSFKGVLFHGGSGALVTSTHWMGTKHPPQHVTPGVSPFKGQFCLHWAFGHLVAALVAPRRPFTRSPSPKRSCASTSSAGGWVSSHQRTGSTGAPPDVLELGSVTIWVVGPKQRSQLTEVRVLRGGAEVGIWDVLLVSRLGGRRWCPADSGPLSF